MPGYMYSSGSIGIVSRYGTLMDEVAWGLTSKGIGQSTCIHIGDYPFLGTTVADLVSLLENDEHTETIIILGESNDFISLQNGRKEIVGLCLDGTKIKGVKMPVYDSIELLCNNFITEN
jgi:succinyl-CoA synthetase alpha subunit